ncbi:hypothetical protein NFI96_025148, partial [Prochilodus magdalenae]
MNGRYDFSEGIEFGATAVAECNEGYQLVGQSNKHRYCQDSGWSGRDPVCQVVQCQEPPGIENGKLEEEPYDSYEYGQAVTYVCNRGFILVGSATISCSSNGEFQDPPKCLREGCDKPTIPNAVRIEGRMPPYRSRSSLRYQCDMGYRMNGSDYIICEVNKWVPSPPQCIEITCGTPDVLNGQITGEKALSYRYNSRVQYSCNTGYRSVGDSHLVCKENGWNPPPPQCKAIQCPEPHRVENGHHDEPSQETYRYGQVLTYSCMQGFKLEGTSTITCSDDETFRPSPPQCLAIRCPEPHHVENGQHDQPSQETYRYGQVLTYSCMQGFKLEGTSKITCSDDETFHPSPPQCLEITCGTPDVLNGTITGEKALSYRYNSRVQYSCNTGYRSVGDSHLVCKENGWNPPPPQCKAIQCPKPHRVENGHHDEPSQETYRYGQVLTYSCLQGFKLKGTSAITCSDDETFRPSPPQCLAIRCPEPHRVENGKHDQPSQETYIYGQVLTYSCMQGFKLEGPSKITCSDDETFHPSPPQCVEITCGTPDVLNGQITGEKALSYRYNSRVQYSCNTGYRSVGDSHLVCKENGWNPPPPQCKEVICGTPDVPNGQITDEKALPYRYNSRVPYSCNTGYRSVGDSHLVCTENGWNQPSPQCIMIKCQRPDIYVGTLEPIQESYDYAQKVKYHCKVLFYSRVSNMLCSADGTFNPPPNCVGHYGILMSVVLLLLVILIVAVCVLLKMKKLYQHWPLFGQCLSSWYKVVLRDRTCRDQMLTSAQCDKPNVGDNRVLTAESNKPTYSEGDTATFQCSVGYQPVDSLASKSVTCSGNKWTELKLQCRKKRCGPLPEISNGGYVYSPEGDDGVLFGATATAQCNPGYQLAGQADRAVRYCRDAGWDGRAHSCEAVQCPAPPQIANGDIDEPREDQYDYGRAVSYKCNKHFTLFGNKTLSCSKDGTFQPNPPECIEVSCKPPTVANGIQISGRAPYGYKSFIEFKCNPDFKMVGSGYLVCERNEWNLPPPICTDGDNVTVKS